MNAPLRHCPIFSYSFRRVKCQDCCEFSHPQHMSYTPAVHLNTPEEEEEEENEGVEEEKEREEGEENRTRR